MMPLDVSALPRVLVVDDEPQTRALLTEILEAEGYFVRTAGTGAEAMRALADIDGAVDLLVLDFGLPDTDGTEIAREVAARYGERPAVFVTGWVDEFVPLAEVPGRWAILQKPIAIPRLLACIRSLGVEPSQRGRVLHGRAAAPAVGAHDSPVDHEGHTALDEREPAE